MRWLVLAALFVSSLSLADVNQTLEFETRLEQRISRLVQIVDPDAHVVVRVQLKKVEVKLPGVSTDFFGTASINKIFQEDIQDIDVKVMSGLVPFPDLIRKEIEAEITVGKIKGRLEIVPLDVGSPIVSRNPIRQVEQLLERYAGGLYKGVLILGFALAALMTFVGLMVLSGMSFWRAQVGRLLGSLNSGKDDENRPSSFVASEEAKDSGQLDQNARIELPPEGLVEIFADCYWSEEDRYARWLWDRLAGTQREALLRDWPVANEYAKYLLGIEPSADSHHSHPYYLRPLALRSVSQTDLQDLVRQRKEIWNLLPSLRREKLELPLSEKLAFTVVKGEVKALDKLTDKKSEPRILTDQSGLGRLSLADEEAIWNDPNLVPDALKKTVVSLVWVAKLAAPAREELLSDFSAADLARCWIGPEPVLSTVLEVLPEKKRKLLLGYRQTTPVDRKAEVFRRLSGLAVERLLAPEPESNGEQNVA